MNNSNIGTEFKKQMKEWFLEHPEIPHQWTEERLLINHPKNNIEKLEFHFNSKAVNILFKEKKYEFQKKLFKSLSEQVLEIRGFWINELLSEKDLEINKPHLKEGQFALLCNNEKYGQVLTVELNVFTGWGDVYAIFNSHKEAKENGRKLLNENIESSIFDSEYNLIENIATNR